MNISRRALFRLIGAAIVAAVSGKPKTTTGRQGIGGIQAIIAASPTTGTVGGINRANFSFWRNRQASGVQTSTAFDNLRSSWTSVFNQCTLGGSQMKPTDVATDRTVYEGYEQILFVYSDGDYKVGDFYG